MDPQKSDQSASNEPQIISPVQPSPQPESSQEQSQPIVQPQATEQAQQQPADQALSQPSQQSSVLPQSSPSPEQPTPPQQAAVQSNQLSQPPVQPTVPSAPGNQPGSEPQPSPQQQPTAVTGNEQQPAAQPEVATQGASDSVAQNVNSAVAPKKSKNKLLVLIALALLGAVTLIGIFLAVRVFSQRNLSLTTYEGESFQIAYPEGYEIKETAESVKFDEPLEEGQSSDEQSFVAVYFSKIPDSISGEEREELKQNYGQLADSFQSIISEEGNNEIKEITESKTTLNGQDAEKFEGVVYEDGEKSGTIVFVSQLNESEFVLVAIAAHVSDPNVAAKANDIIASYKTN